MTELLALYNWEDEVTSGQVYQGDQFGYWCLDGMHLMSDVRYPYQARCEEHQSWGVWGYRIRNNKGEQDVFAEEFFIALGEYDGCGEG